MKRAVSIIFICVFLFSFSAIAQETFTLTTYYPAPFGVYQEMRIHNRLAVGDVNGDGVFDNNDLAHSDDTTRTPINGTIAVGNSIGIGTTSPDSELDITATDSTKGNATITLNSVGTAAGAINSTWKIEALGNGGNYGTEINDGGLQITTTDASGNTTRPISIEQGADSNSIYIDSDGNVGIGTDNPQTRLDVNGDIKITGSAGVNGIQYPDGTKQTSTKFSCVSVQTSWAKLTNGSTISVSCPANYVGVTCEFLFYDTNNVVGANGKTIGSMLYTGFQKSSWNATRTTCSQTINDIGISHGLVYADCCRIP